jgi:hypothetical protein
LILVGGKKGKIKETKVIKMEATNRENDGIEDDKDKYTKVADSVGVADYLGMDEDGNYYGFIFQIF